MVLAVAVALCRASNHCVYSMYIYIITFEVDLVPLDTDVRYFSETTPTNYLETARTTNPGPCAIAYHQHGSTRTLVRILVVVPPPLAPQPLAVAAAVVVPGRDNRSACIRHRPLLRTSPILGFLIDSSRSRGFRELAFVQQYLQQYFAL